MSDIALLHGLKVAFDERPFSVEDALAIAVRLRLGLSVAEIEEILDSLTGDTDAIRVTGTPEARLFSLQIRTFKRRSTQGSSFEVPVARTLHVRAAGQWGREVIYVQLAELRTLLRNRNDGSLRLEFTREETDGVTVTARWVP